MAIVLIIEDDPMFQRALGMGLEGGGHGVQIAGTGQQGLELLAQRVPDIIFLDLYLGKEPEGLEVLDRIRAVHADLPVIIMTGYGTVETAVEAMKRGATDYVQKPLNIEGILLIIDRQLEVISLRREVGYLRRYQDQVMRMTPLIAVSPAMKQVVEIAHKVARNDRPHVLLCGESGTGKDVVASLIHKESPRRHRPFVVVNCGALSDHLADRELFGQEPAGETEASEGLPGKFEVADGGTLLLDEIGEMNLTNQAKLLRVLEDGVVNRLGSTREFRVDNRVIATTRKELPQEVEEGRFREDLYFRLNLVSLKLEPLRQRPQDIVPLAKGFLHEFGSGFGRDYQISSGACHHLLAHSWPGNVRELRNMMERVVLLSSEEAVEPRHLTFQFANQSVLDVGGDGLFASTFDAVKKGEVYDSLIHEMLREALRRTGGNQAEACRWLGLSKARLVYRLKQYGIRSQDFQEN